MVAVRLSAAADVDRDRACQLQLSPGTGNYFGTKKASFETKTEAALWKFRKCVTTFFQANKGCEVRHYGMIVN